MLETLRVYVGRRIPACSIALFLFLGAPVAGSNEEPLLTELPKTEGADRSAPPYELWLVVPETATSSYEAGPRLLLITNDRKTAVAYVRGRRTVLRHVGNLRWECEPGGSMKETYKAGDVTLRVAFTTSPGEEACWVEGTLAVTLDGRTQIFEVTGVSGH